MSRWALTTMFGNGFGMCGDGFQAARNLCQTAVFETEKTKRLSPFQAIADYNKDNELKKVISEAKFKEIVKESAMAASIEYKP